MAARRIALVTGANRGIGFEVSRQLGRQGYDVLMGGRDAAKITQAAHALAAENLTVVPLQVDISDPASIEAAAAQVSRDYTHLDVLVNNAAIYYMERRKATNADLSLAQAAVQTNVLGAWHMALAFLPLLRKGTHARIVNVSSESGSLAHMQTSYDSAIYSMTKAALNAVTRMLAVDLRADGILVNSICPGWVDTEMGGPGGRPIPDGAASVVWAVNLPDDGPTGGFFQDGKPLPW
jgi:NAD(P)-dependent dehydrogenase (short-subunit alcohol dehydrogenase family)